VALAWIGTSLLFGLAHMLNPNATFLGGFNIFLAGLLLGLGYILTGQLGLSIGLHIATNFFQGFVFGYATSGATMAARLISTRVNGPEIWTGSRIGCHRIGVVECSADPDLGEVHGSLERHPSRAG